MSTATPERQRIDDLISRIASEIGTAAFQAHDQISALLRQGSAAQHFASVAELSAAINKAQDLRHFYELLTGFPPPPLADAAPLEVPSGLVWPEPVPPQPPASPSDLEASPEASGSSKPEPEPNPKGKAK